MKKINFLILCILFIFFIIFIPGLSAKGDGKDYPPANGDWSVESKTNVTNKEIILNGNLTIKKDGKLSLDNVTLKINSPKDGEFKIMVEKGGEFYARNTNITANNISYSYKFEVYGKMKLEKCEISYLWGEITTIKSLGGIEIYSDDVSILNSSILNFDIIGIFCKSNNTLIENNIIEIREDKYIDYYGIICNNSTTIISNNTFKNLYYGIFSIYSNGFIYNNTFSCVFSIYYFEGEVKIKENRFEDSKHSINCVRSIAKIIKNEIIGLEVNNCNDIMVENNIIKTITCYFSTVTIIKNKINALFLYNSSAFIENNTVLPNNTNYGITGYGGKIFIYNNTIKEFKSKYSYQNWGISIYSSFEPNVKIKKNQFFNNTIGLSCSNATISENTFSNNEYGLRCHFGNCKIYKNIFENNTNGIYNYNSTLILTKNQFQKNEVAIDTINGKFSIDEIKNNNVFTDNKIRFSQKRVLKIQVTLPNGTPVKYVSTIIKDRDGKEVWNGTTNKYGIATKSFFNQTIQLTEYEIDSTGIEIRYSPYNITVEKDNVINWTEFELNENTKIIKINLKEPKPNIKEAGNEFDLKFMVGLVALIIFFATIIFSLIGIIPQDRLPIQTALVIMAFVIAIIAYIAHSVDKDISRIGAVDISGMIILHPITALAAGFLVAGALEAAGAFDAAADLLDRLEKFKFKGKVIFGVPGTIVILVNVPTIIAMPCGRILGSALMPAALYFGYKVAKQLKNPGMVGVIVFAFIVNAAASCGPSPLGGIGTIGEGLTRTPIGSFSDAQQIGIIMATGVCALVIKFVTPLIPADLKEEEEETKEERENENKEKIDRDGGEK